MALQSGTLLGTYTVTSLIGAGGMGEVYQAHDAKLDRDVAIKVLRSRLDEIRNDWRDFSAKRNCWRR
jgi:serine/threonine protein kinase